MKIKQCSQVGYMFALPDSTVKRIMMEQGKHGAKMQELSLHRLPRQSTSARIEIRGGLNYSNLATDDLVEENIDHRILRCQHPRLRAALQFNNQSAQSRVEKKVVLHQVSKTQNTPGIDDELGTGAKALIKVTKMVFSCVSALMSPL